MISEEKKITLYNVLLFIILPSVHMLCIMYMFTLTWTPLRASWWRASWLQVPSSQNRPYGLHRADAATSIAAYKIKTILPLKSTLINPVDYKRWPLTILEPLCGQDVERHIPASLIFSTLQWTLREPITQMWQSFSGDIPSFLTFTWNTMWSVFRLIGGCKVLTAQKCHIVKYHWRLFF